jgi:hypothetical protein
MKKQNEVKAKNGIQPEWISLSASLENMLRQIDARRAQSEQMKSPFRDTRKDK